MKGLRLWVALGGLVSACALEVEEPGSEIPSPPRPPPFPPPGGFGSGGTAQGQGATAGGGGASSQRPRGDAGATQDSPGCISNEDCRAGFCVNAGCQAFCAGNAGCADGEACVLGLCRPDAGRGWECIDRGDCADNEDCVAGSCLRRCLRDGHCNAEQELCSFGYCGLPL